MSLDNPAQDISPRSCDPSTCEACGQAFTCGAQLSGCWCMEVALSEAVRAELRTRFQNCLCRACLERFARSGNEICEKA
jgi:hypothetical protein